MVLSLFSCPATNTQVLVQSKFKTLRLYKNGMYIRQNTTLTSHHNVRKCKEKMFLFLVTGSMCQYSTCIHPSLDTKTEGRAEHLSYNSHALRGAKLNELCGMFIWRRLSDRFTFCKLYIVLISARWRFAQTRHTRMWDTLWMICIFFTLCRASRSLEKYSNFCITIESIVHNRFLYSESEHLTQHCSRLYITSRIWLLFYTLVLSLTQTLNNAESKEVFT